MNEYKSPDISKASDSAVKNFTFLEKKKHVVCREGTGGTEVKLYRVGSQDDLEFVKLRKYNFYSL